jgi:hypothetical protein
MDIQTLKLELVKQILNLESKDLINRLFLTLRKEDKDFVSNLTDSQKREIELGLSQIEKGETEDWDGFLRRVS